MRQQAIITDVLEFFLQNSMLKRVFQEWFRKYFQDMIKNKKGFTLNINTLAHAYNDTLHFIIPLLLPFFQIEFSFTYFQSGLVLTFYEALRSIFSLLYGVIADRFGHRNLIIALGIVLSSVLLGSVTCINKISLIITALLLMAIAISTFHPLATAMVGEKAQPGKQGRDLSLFSASGTIGLVIMSLFFGWLVQIWGWRTTCFIIALPGLLLGWFYAKISEVKQEVKITGSRINHHNLFAIFFLSKSVLCLGTKVFLSFLPIYLTTYIRLKPGISAWIISIYFTGVFIGNILICQLLDRKNPLQFVIFSIASLTILIFLLTCSRVLLLIGIIVVTIGLMEGIYYPAQSTWLNMVSSHHNRGSLFGFGFFMEGLTATIAPTIYGWFADNYGIVYAYRLMIIPIFISLLLNITLFQAVEKYQNQNIKVI